MNRRGFLHMLGGAIATAPIVAMAAPKIWTPAKQLVGVKTDEIEITREFVSNGQTVYGYLLAPDNSASGFAGSHAQFDLLRQDALDNFPSNAPVLILSNVSGIELNRNLHNFARFRFIGSKAQAVERMKAQVIGAFEDKTAFGYLASK